jgi:hypothetical protein
MQELLSLLETAFPARRIEPSRFIEDWGLWDTYVSRQSFDAGSKGRTWLTLGDEFIEAHYSALRWMRPDVFGEILPAYLAALVHGKSDNTLPDEVVRQLTRRETWEEEFDQRVSLLSKAQRDAVRTVLEHLPTTERWSHYRDEFALALDSWKNATPPAP